MKFSFKLLALALGIISLSFIASCSKEDPYTRRYIIKQDLGLNIYWTDFNLCDTNFCTTSTEQPGAHFAWGEFRDKNKFSYTWDTYKYSNGTKLTKYNNKASLGTVDNLVELKLDDDAAFMHLGTPWHLPSVKEFEDLISATKSKWVADYNGTGCSGMLFSRAGCPSIFFPASGYKEGDKVILNGTWGFYWTKDVCQDDCRKAYALVFNYSYVEIQEVLRYKGLSTRPVVPNYNYVGK